MKTSTRYSALNIIINIMYIIGFVLIAVGLWEFFQIILTQNTKLELSMKIMSAIYLFGGGVSILFSAAIGHIIIDIALAVIPSKNTETQKSAFKSSSQKVKKAKKEKEPLFLGNKVFCKKCNEEKDYKKVSDNYNLCPKCNSDLSSIKPSN